LVCIADPPSITICVHRYHLRFAGIFMTNGKSRKHTDQNQNHTEIGFPVWFYASVFFYSSWNCFANCRIDEFGIIFCDGIKRYCHSLYPLAFPQREATSQYCIPRFFFAITSGSFSLSSPLTSTR